MSAVECWSALQTERAFPLLTSFRPVLMDTGCHKLLYPDRKVGEL
jgi:hypothetical protein